MLTEFNTVCMKPWLSSLNISRLNQSLTLECLNN